MKINDTKGKGWSNEYMSRHF